MGTNERNGVHSPINELTTKDIPWVSRDRMGSAPETDPRPYEVRTGAKVLCRHRGSVLLVQERHVDDTPFWTLPGGGVKEGESPREALTREVSEELQCGVIDGTRIGSMWYQHRSKPRTVTRYTVFEGTLTCSPTPNPEQGVHACRWVNDRSPPARTLQCVTALLRRHLDTDEAIAGNPAQQVVPIEPT